MASAKPGINTDPVCADCTLRQGKTWRGPVVHCEGAKAPTLIALNQATHHGHRKWRCPRCKADLGCDRCNGRFANEVLCIRCQTFMNGDVVEGCNQPPLVVPQPQRPSRVKSAAELSVPAGDRE